MECALEAVIVRIFHYILPYRTVRFLYRNFWIKARLSWVKQRLPSSVEAKRWLGTGAIIRMHWIPELMVISLLLGAALGAQPQSRPTHGLILRLARMVIIISLAKDAYIKLIFPQLVVVFEIPPLLVACMDSVHRMMDRKNAELLFHARKCFYCVLERGGVVESVHPMVTKIIRNGNSIFQRSGFFARDTALMKTFGQNWFTKELFRNPVFWTQNIIVICISTSFCRIFRRTELFYQPSTALHVKKYRPS